MERSKYFLGARVQAFSRARPQKLSVTPFSAHLLFDLPKSQLLIKEKSLNLKKNERKEMWEGEGGEQRKGEREEKGRARGETVCFSSLPYFLFCSLPLLLFSLPPDLDKFIDFYYL